MSSGTLPTTPGVDAPEQTLDPDRPAEVPFGYPELVSLELERLRRELLREPALVSYQFGPNFPNEHTERGYQRDPYMGVVIYNPTPATILVGFQVGQAQGALAPAIVPPWSFASFPQRFVNLSLGVSASDGQIPNMAPVTALRCYSKPPPQVGSMAPGAPPQPLTSFTAQVANGTNGQILDNGFPRANHSLIVVTSAGVTGGVVQLQVSNDGVNFANGVATSALSASNVVQKNLTGPFRWIRAAITTAVAGGTATAIVSSV